MHLQNNNNIVLCASTFHGKIIHITLALYLLYDYDKIFREDNPRAIAERIIELCLKLHSQFKLQITLNQISRAVKLTEYIRQNKHKFPYTNIIDEDNQDDPAESMQLLPKDKSSEPKRGFCSIV
jgi:hypothetical protein